MRFPKTRRRHGLAERSRPRQVRWRLSTRSANQAVFGPGEPDAEASGGYWSGVMDARKSVLAGLPGAVDPLGHRTVSAFDALNRLIRLTDPGAGVTQLAYDGQDWLTGVTDPRNLSTTFAVDGLGNRTQQVSPDTGDHKTQLVLEMQSGRPEQGLAGGRRQRVSLHRHEQPAKLGFVLPRFARCPMLFFDHEPDGQVAHRLQRGDREAVGREGSGRARLGLGRAGPCRRP